MREEDFGEVLRGAHEGNFAFALIRFLGRWANGFAVTLCRGYGTSLGGFWICLFSNLLVLLCGTVYRWFSLRPWVILSLDPKASENLEV